MKATSLTFILALAPAALLAQASGSAQASGQASASAQGKQASASGSADANASVQAPREWSAESRAKLDAVYDDARARKLPLRPIARRVQEGRAKGAAEATIVGSATVTRDNLAATQEAMVSAGRAHPADAELERGAHAMERGVTKAQVEAIARRTPPDRSLVVAFDVVAKLTERGVSATDAVAQVQTKLDANATDATLTSMTTSATSQTNVDASATAGKATTGVAGKVTGTVTGAVKKP